MLRNVYIIDMEKERLAGKIAKLIFSYELIWRGEGGNCKSTEDKIETI